MPNKKKHLPESVYAKLRNIAFAKKRPVQEILKYYAMERFLYRLSVSQYRGSFFLKGGLMLKVWDPGTHRPTIDIDLLARMNNSVENISRIFREICSHLVAQDDGVEFDTTNLLLTESQIQREYTGLSARFSARVHTTKLPLRVDIGFSDKILPKPAKFSYPCMLDFPAPELQGYTPETTIAEKLDAIIKLGLANSRMKDFYDIWMLLRQFQIKPEKLSPIVKQVFKNRKTVVHGIPKAFSSDFYSSTRTKTRWKAFLKNIGDESIELESVVAEIREFFLPILEEKASP